MSIDSSFEDQTQGSVPSKPEPEPEPGSEEPQRPDDPGQPDPLKNPKDERPEDWRDPAERDMPEADEEALSADDAQ